MPRLKPLIESLRRFHLGHSLRAVTHDTGHHAVTQLVCLNCDVILLEHRKQWDPESVTVEHQLEAAR